MRSLLQVFVAVTGMSQLSHHHMLAAAANVSQHSGIMITNQQGQPVFHHPSVILHGPAPLNMHNAPSAAAAAAAANAKRHRESYTVRDKIAMVRKFQREDPPLSVRKFAQTYGIPANTFKHWLQLYEGGVPEELTGVESQSRRRIRPGKYPLLERRVVEFLKNRSPHEPKIHWTVLRDHCEDWAKDLPDDERSDFTLTNGWIARVLKRNSLTNVEGGDIYPFNEYLPLDTHYEDISEKFIVRKRSKHSSAMSSSMLGLSYNDSNEIPDYPSDVALQRPPEHTMMTMTHPSIPPPPPAGLSHAQMQQQSQQQQVIPVTVPRIPIMDHSPSNVGGNTGNNNVVVNVGGNNPGNSNSSNNNGGELTFDDVDQAIKVIIRYSRNKRLFDVLDTTYQLAMQLREPRTHSLGGPLTQQAQPPQQQQHVPPQQPHQQHNPHAHPNALSQHPQHHQVASVAVSGLGGHPQTQGHQQGMGVVGGPSAAHMQTLAQQQQHAQQVAAVAHHREAMAAAAAAAAVAAAAAQAQAHQQALSSPAHAQQRGHNHGQHALGMPVNVNGGASNPHHVMNHHLARHAHHPTLNDDDDGDDDDEDDSDDDSQTPPHLKVPKEVVEHAQHAHAQAQAHAQQQHSHLVW